MNADAAVYGMHCSVSGGALLLHELEQMVKGLQPVDHVNPVEDCLHRRVAACIPVPNAEDGLVSVAIGLDLSKTMRKRRYKA